MGGLGSGDHYDWWQHDKKTVVEDCLRLDTTLWRREGLLKAGQYAAGTLRWTYPGGSGFTVQFQVDARNMDCPLVRLRHSWVWGPTEQEESADYPVQLTTTRPRFGGLRWWLVCPLVVSGRPCGRRVGKLYLPPQAPYFGCRQCHQLTYTTCQESHKYDRLYRRLAGDLGLDFDTVRRTMNSIGRRK